MANENRFYLTASELSDLMGISIGHAYKLIRDMNAELAKEGYIVVAGKVPKRYVEKALLWLHAAVRWGCDCKEKSIDREVGCPIQLYRLAGKTQKTTKRGFRTKREAVEWYDHFRATQDADFNMVFKDFYRNLYGRSKPPPTAHTMMTSVSSLISISYRTLETKRSMPSKHRI